MKIFELSVRGEIDVDRLAALTQFLINRAEDKGAKKVFSIRSYIDLAKDLGIPLTKDQLVTMSSQPPLNSMISNIEGDSNTGMITFGNENNEPKDTMSVDQARATVDKMAKRAAKDKL